MKFIITGCGRSGTGYIADRLNNTGLSCGHENVFTVNGPTRNFRNYDGDSSWFAAPYIGQAYSSAKILHVVRDPLCVIESFHRIGLCANKKYRHFSKGQGLLRILTENKFSLTQMKHRWGYVKSHRNLLKKNTNCFSFESEFKRLCEYWFQWNQLIELNAREGACSYMRVRLEDVDCLWPEIQKFLELPRTPEPGSPTNKKNSYRSVQPFHMDLPANVKELAKAYGYKY